MPTVVGGDDRQTAGLVRRGLEEAGYAVDHAGGGQAAFAHAWDLRTAGSERTEILVDAQNGDLFIARAGDERDPVLARFSFEAP